MDPLIKKLQEEPLIKEVLSQAQLEGKKLFLVGGYLRDLILNSEKKTCDLDFTLKKGAISFAKNVSRRIKGFFVLLDDEHGCARVVINKGNDTFILDFADFRAADIKEDLRLRDFRINSLAVDISRINKAEDLSDIVIDYYGGRKDLENKIIDIATKKSFLDDPLRVVRAFSLSSILGFKITPRTISQIKNDKEKVSIVAFERIRDELFKIFDSPRAFETLKIMDRLGVLEEIIPEIKIMKNVSQGGYHHLDVWEHSLEAVKQLERIYEQQTGNEKIQACLNEIIASNRRRASLLKLGALLHDIGKPKSMKIEEGRTRFHGHEHIGRRMVRNISQRFKLSTKENDSLEKMILWHLRPGYLADFKMPTARAVFRYFRDTEPEGISILLVSLADQRATRGPLTNERSRKHHEKIIMELIDYFFAKKEEKELPRLLTGYDLIRKLKLKPSPIFAKILKKIEESQAVGKIKTKQDALELARKIAKVKV